MRVAVANWLTNMGFKAECSSSVGGSELNSEVLLEYAANLIEACATMEQADQHGRSVSAVPSFYRHFRGARCARELTRLAARRRHRGRHG